MAEQGRRISVGVTVSLLVAMLLLCGVSSAAMFFIGRTTAPQVAEAAPDAAVREVEVTREVIRDVVREVTPVPGAATNDAPEAAPEATTAAEAPASTPQPDATEGEDEPFVPPPTPTFVPGERGEFSEADLQILYEAWGIVEENYDGDLPNDVSLRNAIIGYTISLLGDPNTRWVNPDVAARDREARDGSFEGIGAYVEVNDAGEFEIVRPIDGQPAERAGLRAGDIVVAVDGVPLTGKTIDESIQLVRGPRGTPVTLTIARTGVADPFDITIVRETIVIPVVESEMLDGNIAYIRLTTFNNRNTEAQFRAALEPLLAENPVGIILDLRDNPGGFLDQVVEISDIFLPEGVILRERNNSGFSQIFRSEDGDIAEEIPLAVLVNGGSASASEILAGAVQDTGRGIVIGEVTFGKGSVQTVRALSDGSEIRVTIARWFTPNDNSIDGVGVTPDIELPTPEDFGGDGDTQLSRAVDYILNGE